MKTLRNIFGKKDNLKSISSFSQVLDIKTMLLVKGGDDDPQDDTWPPDPPPQG